MSGLVAQGLPGSWLYQEDDYETASTATGDPESAILRNLESMDVKSADPGGGQSHAGSN